MPTTSATTPKAKPSISQQLPPALGRKSAKSLPTRSFTLKWSKSQKNNCGKPRGVSQSYRGHRQGSIYSVCQDQSTRSSSVASSGSVGQYESCCCLSIPGVCYPPFLDMKTPLAPQQADLPLKWQVFVVGFWLQGTLGETHSLNLITQKPGTHRALSQYQP
ncbi:hypothetical protein PM082_023377 [Marasmius tenuissimus]|nr:hypothetical protein PM082_023377 [Marasmius tenuissimus]